jgi:hypothetical protein
MVSDTVEVARNVGIIAAMVGVIGTAIKAGQWKGEHDAKLKTLETVLDKTVDKLARMDDRIDGVERTLLETLTGLKKDVEYIKLAVDGLQKRRREDYAS